MSLKAWSGKLRKAYNNPSKATNHIISTIEDKWIKHTGNSDYILDWYNGPGHPVGNVLISYLPEPLNYFKFSPKFKTSSNRWQIIEIVNIFNNIGFSVDIFNLSTNKTPPDFTKYDVVFGLGQNFNKFCNEVPENTVKIFYSTGLHYKHQQCRQEERIKRLNQRKGVDFTSERKFGSGNNINKADVMVTFQKSQRESYEDYLNRSIPTYYINLSTYPKLDSVTDIESKNFSETRKNFLWFGGSGLVSKGLDITLDIFKNFDDINLFVAGPVEGNEEFIDIYYNEIYDTNNIEFLGFVDITGNRFENMVNECAYHIYPTAVDPLSSSVATCMRAGLIPIAPSNPVSGIENWGISLKNTSLEHIEETVRDCASKDPKEVQSLSKIARQKANSDFTRPRFSQDLHSALIDILIDKNNSYQRDP